MKSNLPPLRELLPTLPQDTAMALRAVALLGLSLLYFCCSHPLSRPNSGLNKCRSAAKSLPALEVLPGGGWDNLRNVDMGRVMNLSFSLCLTTEDGLYLVPDEVFVIPQKVTRVETNSEIISSWLDQKGSTSSSINADISFFSVLNAKFSTENQRMKTHQVRDPSLTTRVQVSYTSTGPTFEKLRSKAASD